MTGRGPAATALPPLAAATRIGLDLAGPTV
jgi:hypothetical protein